MGHSKALLLTSGLLIALGAPILETTTFGSAALAADLLLPSLPPAPYVAEPVEMSGWYLRGDIGVSAPNKPGLNYDLLTSGNADGSRKAGTFLDQDMASQGIVGIGAGYTINNWFRTDATLEYRGKSGFNGIDQYACQCITGDTTYYNVNSQWRGNVASVTGLLNAYADVGTWYNITPYVGVGIGTSYNRTTGITELGTYYKAGNYFVEDQQYSSGKSKLSFAWALMTGLAYNINANTKLEIGYRYINLGKAVTGTETQAPTSTGYAFDNLKTKNLVSQDFRIGMRWMLNNPAPAYQHEPLVRKY
eukprot:gene13479-13594_t